MGPKAKGPPEAKGGKEGGQKEQGGKGGGKGGKKKDGEEALLVNEDSLPLDAEQPPPEEPFCPPAVVTPEFVYNTGLTLEEIQDIYTLSDITLEDAARKLAVILGLEDCVFDARNLILLEYCLGNLMFAKQAGLNSNQALEIYDMGHMVLDIIRDEKPFAEAERLFKNRLLSRSVVKYRTAPDPTQKENDQWKDENQPKGDEAEAKDTQKETGGKKKSKDTDQAKEDKEGKEGKEGKKAKKGKKSAAADGKPEEANKSKKDDKSKDSNNTPEADIVDEPKKDEKEDEPLFSRLDVKKITPYFTSTVFQHYCLYQYCFNRVHYNIRRTEKVFVQTALTYPLTEAKSEKEVAEEEAQANYTAKVNIRWLKIEFAINVTWPMTRDHNLFLAARIAAEEKAIQDAYAAQWRAEQSLFESIAAEARRLAEEEMARRALTLDEYIERAVRHRIEEAKKELIVEYEHREHVLIDKILLTHKEQEAAAAAATAAAIATQTAGAAEKGQPAAAPPVGEKETKKKKGKSA